MQTQRDIGCESGVTSVRSVPFTGHLIPAFLLQLQGPHQLLAYAGSVTLPRLLSPWDAAPWLCVKLRFSRSGTRFGGF